MTTIVYYGIGNPTAFINVFKRINRNCKIATNQNDLKDASKIILPGVGHFDDALNKLKSSDMYEKINDLVVNKSVPVLGICVGMQIMAISSEEGENRGLGWINGKVKKFNNIICPHMGWNEINVSKQSKLFSGIDRKLFYFLHSYYFECSEKSDELGISNYRNEFVSAVNKKNIYGVQFHPEKSHEAGEKLVKNFVDLC